jgi:hypothetical protein
MLHKLTTGQYVYVWQFEEDLDLLYDIKAQCRGPNHLITYYAAEVRYIIRSTEFWVYSSTYIHRLPIRIKTSLAGDSIKVIILVEKYQCCELADIRMKTLMTRGIPTYETIFQTYNLTAKGSKLRANLKMVFAYRVFKVPG